MEKEHVYLVEVTFEAVAVEENVQTLKLQTEVATFKDFKKSEAKRRAQDFYDRVIRYGLSKSGGSVVKAQVPPNCIKNIALVDYDKYQEDAAVMMEQAQAMAQESEASAGLVTPDVEASAEPADIALEVGSN